jgi:hypothetical protein
MLIVTTLGVSAHQAPDLARSPLSLTFTVLHISLSPFFESGQVSVFLTVVSVCIKVVPPKISHVQHTCGSGTVSE